VFARDFLVIGTESSSIAGYSVNKAGVIQKKAWNVQLASEVNEVNDLFVDSENDVIYAACDKIVYVCSLEDGSIIRKLCGHTDFIHSVHGQ
jgi:hypothetical protein